MSRSVTVPDAIRPAPPSGELGMGTKGAGRLAVTSLKGSSKPRCVAGYEHVAFEQKRSFQGGSQVAEWCSVRAIGVRGHRRELRRWFSGPAELSQPRLSDTEVVTNLVKQRDTHPAGQVLRRAGGPTDRGEEERDSIRIDTHIAAPLRKGNPLVEAESGPGGLSSSIMIATFSISARRSSGIVAKASATKTSKASTVIGSMTTTLPAEERGQAHGVFLDVCGPGGTSLIRHG